jgi:hypothetical protein
MSLLRALWHHLASPSAIYGLIVYASLITATAADDENGPLAIFVFSAVTLVAFWIAHVFSAALGHHGGEHRGTVTVARSLRHALAESVGLLEAAILPSIPLLMGVFGALTSEEAVAWALRVVLVTLAGLGYSALAIRGNRWWWCLLGCLVSTAIGAGIIFLESILH